MSALNHRTPITFLQEHSSDFTRRSHIDFTRGKASALTTDPPSEYVTRFGHRRQRNHAFEFSCAFSTVANVHTHDTSISVDDLAFAEREAERFVALPRGVELLAAFVQHARIVESSPCRPLWLPCPCRRSGLWFRVSSGRTHNCAIDSKTQTNNRSQTNRIDQRPMLIGGETSSHTRPSDDIPTSARTQRRERLIRSVVIPIKRCSQPPGSSRWYPAAGRRLTQDSRQGLDLQFRAIPNALPTARQQGVIASLVPYSK